MIKALPAAVHPQQLRLLNHAHPERYPFLLQSTAQDGAAGAGYDILFGCADEQLVLTAGHELLGHVAAGKHRFLDALDAWWQTEQGAVDTGELPFYGGWFVYLGYELAGQVEAKLRLHEDPQLPTAFAVRCKSALIYDHAAATSWWVSETGDTSELEQLEKDLRKLQGLTSEAAAVRIAEDDPEPFIDAVLAAKRYIAAGDVYQANLSRQWAVQVAPGTSATSIYASLCKANPAPFAGIARWQDTVILSSSPERLVQVGDGKISTRPIAGTRRRGIGQAADEGLSAELIAHPKERAEHVMLIDLERNDLGRVCQPGSVQVNEFMAVESYAHVHHIVSNVRGVLRDKVTPGEAIAAVFPGGTITGCPKVRCMEIIAELETSPRGAYTGSFGYLNRDGSLDLNILIRTMVKRGDECWFRAGAGIVADSVPLAELDETRAKAEGMLKAFHLD